MSNTCFRVFFVCLISCAIMVLGIIWHVDDDSLPPAYFQITATLFVVGLASFLIWFSATLAAIREKLQEES